MMVASSTNFIRQLPLHKLKSPAASWKLCGAPDSPAGGSDQHIRQTHGSTEPDRRCLRSRNDAYELAVLRAFGFELHLTFRFREQGVVLANAYVAASVETSATLTDDDAARSYSLAAVALDTKSFRLGIATVTGTTCCLFMSHYQPPSLRGYSRA